MNKKIEFQHWSVIYHMEDSDDLYDDELPKIYEFDSYEERMEHMVKQVNLGGDLCQMVLVYREQGDQTVFICRQSPHRVIDYLKSINKEAFIVLHEANHEDHEQLINLISEVIYS